MDFLDKTGHIFTLDSYENYPIGYEFQENDYIFWFDTENGYKLSIDNYYFKSIRLITRIYDKDDINISISLKDSNKFYLIGSKFIEDKIYNQNIQNVNDRITLYENDIINSKSLNYHCNFSLYQDNEYNPVLSEDGDLKGIVVVDNIQKIYTKTSYLMSRNTPYTGDTVLKFEKNSPELENYNYVELDIENDDDYIYLGEIEIGGIIRYIQILPKQTNIIYDESLELSDDELDTVKEIKEMYLIIPFYCIVNSNEAGTWETNVLIDINTLDNHDYCPITVAAEIVDENEELIINGQNIGVRLPKDIINAIYSSTYNSDYIDERKYEQKLKEYLLNFMDIKGQQGNYNSILNSLKWFEWGDKLTISKLIKTDNDVQTQYIHNLFDLVNDNLYSYQLFRETSLISLRLKLFDELEPDLQLQNLQQGFIGEGKSNFHNKIYDNVIKRYDEEDIDFYRGYFDFTFNELGLKLAVLKYYYEKYFLPIHISVHNIYMYDKVYANDIKLINKTSHCIVERPIYVNQFEQTSQEYKKELSVSFNNTGFDILYLNRIKDYIDKEYNSFKNTKERGENNLEDVYYIDDTAFFIPIDISNVLYGDNDKIIDNTPSYYNVHIYLSKYIDSDNLDLVRTINGKEYPNTILLHETSFSFIQNEDNKYNGLVIYPKLINNESGKFDINWWIDHKYRIDCIINGQIFEYIFTLKLPELNIQIGKLEYRYNDIFRQINKINEDGIEFNSFMYQPDLVTVNNIDFIEDIYFKEDIQEYIEKYYTSKINMVNDKYLNRCHLIDILDSDNKHIQYTSEENSQLFEELSISSIDLYHDINSSETTVNLYKEFFNDDGSYKIPQEDLYINGNYYDFYLMHDYKQWYGVLISKNTIDLHTKKDKAFKFNNNTKKYKFGDYTLKYIRSDSKILINRYNYVPSYGVNHFKTTDMVVLHLYNNDKLPFKPSLGSKWTISPLSIGMAAYDEVESNSELAIISIGDKNSKYEPGYYSVTVKYCVDDFIQHEYTKIAKFRIDENINIIDKSLQKNYYKFFEELDNI